MKIVCVRNDLLAGINIVQRAVASKTTMDILECILIEAFNEQIKLTANNNELGIETYIDGKILEEGSIALEAKLFSEIVKKTPDNDITFETNDNYTTDITCENIHYAIQGKGGEDFTRLPDVEREKMVSVSQFDFKEIIRQTSFSVLNSDNNKLMTGELLQVEGNTMTMTSLDGHRISIRRINLAESYETLEAIIPAKSLNEIARILSGEAKDRISLYFSEKHVLFEFDRTKVVSRLLDGKFYNIKQMVSSDYETKVLVNKMTFMSSLDRSTLFIKETDKKPIILNIGPEKMDLSIRTPIGSMNDSLMIHQEGKDIRIGLNPRFMLDALRSIDDDEVTLYFINSIAPCVIRNDSESYRYLILPINIKSMRD